MNKICTAEGFDFYIGKVVPSTGNQTLYNIVPSGSKNPLGGYINKEFIESKHNVKFPIDSFTNE